MTGTYIDIAAEDGGSFKAYQALPAAGRGPAVIILQEIFGISPTMKWVADGYAEKGYVAVVPDLFWRLEPGVSLGYAEADFAKARDLNGRFDSTAATRDMAATVKALRASPVVTGKIGAVGFCLGGRLAVLAAAHAGVDGAVGYYGVAIEKEPAAIAAVQVPLMLHFAGKDAYTPPDVIAQITEGFKAKPQVEIFTYPEADHGFNSPARADRYHPTVAAQALDRTLGFLKRVVG